MKQSGITIEKCPVYADVFPLVGTHGVPLELILSHFRDTGRVMDWLDYISMALKDGHKIKTIKARIISAVGDVYGKKYCREIETRLNAFIRD